MFYCRKGVTINDTGIIFKFQRKCISTTKKYFMLEIWTLHFAWPLLHIHTVHTIFCSRFIQQNRYFLKNIVHFLSLPDCLLTCQWIVYKMNAVSSFQLTGLCGLLFISFVCCDLKCMIYFSPVLLSFFFLSELEEDKQNVLIYK